MKLILILLLIPTLVFSKPTEKRIDQINQETGTDIIINPTNDVKVNSFTGGFALISGALKELSESIITTIELSYMSGVTSSVQTQVDGKEDTLPWNANGDMVYFQSAGNIIKIPIGPQGQVLQVGASSNPLFGSIPSIDLTSGVTGILPISNGGTGSATQIFVDLTTNQSIAGLKTFTGQYVSVSTANGNRPCPVMTEVQRDAIGAPSEGDCIVNSDTSQLNYYLGGAWGQVGGGSGGSGTFNYLVGDDTDLEIAVGGWTGEAGITVSRNVTNGFNFRGEGFLQTIKGTGDKSGLAVKSIVFSIDSQDLGKEIVIKFDHEVLSGDYVSGDIAIEVIKDPLGSPSTITTSNPNMSSSKSTHVTSFVADEVEKDYQLIFRQVSTDLPPTNIGYDNIKVIPATEEASSLGASLNAITDWEVTNTPNITGTTSGTLLIGTGGSAEYTIDKRQVGDSIELRYAIRIGTSGAADVVGSYNFSLPSPLTLDTLDIKFGEVIGYGNIVSTASGATVQRLIMHSTSSTGFRVGNADGSTLAAGGALFDNANVVSFFIEVPIVGLSSGLTAIVQRKISLRAKMSASANLSVPNAIETQMVFTTNNYDNLGSVNIASNSITIPHDGVYTITPKALLLNTVTTSAPNNSRAFVTVKKGGVFEAQLGSFRLSQATNVTGWAFDIGIVSYDGEFKAGDVLTFFIEHNFGANVVLSSNARMAIREHSGSPIIVGTFGKCQEKFLSGDIGVGGQIDISSLRFSNISIGSRYRLCMSPRTDYPGGADNIDLIARDNGVAFLISTMSSATNLVKKGYICRSYTPSVTTLTFDANSIGTGNFMRGNGTLSETWVELCEDSKGVTTQW